MRTDHGALLSLMKSKTPSGQLARWLEVLSTYRFVIKHRAGVKHGNCDALSRVNRPCTSCMHWERREEEKRETCQCSNLNETNQSNHENNGQREIIQKSSKEYEGMEKVSILESKEKGGSTSKRDSTEWELQKHTDAESIRRLGYLHGVSPSQDVKSEDSTAENSNSSKCEKDQVQSKYVRYPLFGRK